MQPLTSWDVPKQAEPAIPPTVQKALSYYAAATSGGDLEQDYRQSIAEFQHGGKSTLVENAQKRWEQEQDEDAKNVIEKLIRDPSVPQEMKRGVVASYVMGGYIAQPLREKYKEQVAATDNSTSMADKRAQDIWISTMQQRDQTAQEVQDVIDRFGTTLSDSNAAALAGVARDVLPVAQLAWNFSVAGVAKEAGVSKPWDLFLPGSANKRIKEKYQALPVEEKKAFVLNIIEAYKDTPSFDINRWLDFQAQIEREVEPGWMTTLDNVAGALNWIGLGFLTKAPTSAAKLAGAGVKGKPRPFTQKPTPGTRAGETFEGEATRVTDDVLELRGPTVPPRSPAGTTATANPRSASGLGAAAVADKSGEVAEGLGTSRGALVSDWILPKLDDSIPQIYPDIAADLAQLDRAMRGIYIDTQYNPAIIPVTQRERDAQVYFNALKEVRGPHYQQPNSVYEETANAINGRAVFGRNEAFGYDTVEEAVQAASVVDKAISPLNGVKSNSVKVINKGHQYYVQWDYTKEYDAFAHLAFGDKSVSFKFGGINGDAVARSWFAKFIPPTMRMDTWVPFGAASSERHAAKVENDFIAEIRQNVANTKHKTELYNLLRATEETGEYLRPHQIHSMFPDLNAEEMKDLVRSYAYFRRLVDYEYNWANRLDKADKAARGYKGIYRDGEEMLYGATDFPADAYARAVRIMDLENNVPITKPKPDETLGRTVVMLETPIINEHGIFQFGILAENKARLGPLPAQTLPRIDGYIPRRNKENYYVMKIPKATVINGVKETNPDVLRNYSKVIGAGDTAAKAEALAARYSNEFPDFDIEVRPDRGDTGIAVITEYRVYKEVMDFGKKRGERLPTVDGPARIEDPLVALIDTIKLTTRMDAWRDYSEAFKKNFLARYGKWVRDGKFPESEADFVAKKAMSTEHIKEFKNAQRLYEQWVNQQYKTTFGDEMWDAFFYNLSTVFEKLPVASKYHQALKDIGKKGNLLVRLPKTLGTHLFMYSNVPRQWIIQPQQIGELAFLDPLYAVRAPAEISGVFTAILARAKLATDYRKILEESALKMSGMSRKDFYDTVEAIHKSGMPQSVDLNMTLHGMLRDVERPLVESTGEKIMEGAKNVVAFPTSVGKGLGYSPAELTNQIGLWLFARSRWLKNNPGKNWNTPENIEQITNQAWDIGHSMSTRAGALPFQDGAISLLMQFAAVTHKAFWQLFSSKTLTGQERAKLAAARMALYGVYGVAGGGLIDKAIDKYGPEEYQEDWDKWKRGIQDYVTNNLANLFLNPDEPRTDLAVSQTSSPMPQTLPYLDLVIELSKFRKDSPESPRFPFTHAVGSLFEAAEDVANLTRIKDIGTPESLQIAAAEAMEIFSGYNNFAKAMMIKNYGDKINKFGTPLGLELNRIEMVSQMFGIVTNKELALYSVDRKGKERDQFIKDHAKNVLSGLAKLQAKSGEQMDAEKWWSQIASAMTFIDEEYHPEIIEEIRRQDRQNLLTKNESIILKIFNGHKEVNDKHIAEMIEDLKASENPQAHRMLKWLESEGIKQ